MNSFEVQRVHMPRFIKIRPLVYESIYDKQRELYIKIYMYMHTRIQTVLWPLYVHILTWIYIYEDIPIILKKYEYKLTHAERRTESYCHNKMYRPKYTFMLKNMCTHTHTHTHTHTQMICFPAISYSTAQCQF